MIKDVAYNTGGAISGTTQVSNVAIATDNNPDYTEGSWVGGVDDSDGYVIVSDTTTTGLVGRTTGGGTGVAQADTPTFWKSAGLTDQDLVDLINKLPGSEGNYPNVTAARVALATSPYAIVNDYTGGGPGWYFYSDEGAINIEPPFPDGQAIFIIDNMGSFLETFNPNKSSGTDSLNFNIKDSAGVDHTTEFTNLENNGGTISVTQNGNTATYVLTIGMAHVDTENGLLFVNTNAATQTVIAGSPFVYGDPITITIS